MLDAPTFSIVLCTRNRAELLRGALASIREVDYPSDDFELLLVDNASSDATPELVREFSLTTNFPVRYLREDKLGLSAARNRGIREARGQYLFFTDDDQLVDRQSLREHRRVAEKYGARVVQGAILLSFVETRPPWLYGKLARILGETQDFPEGPAPIELCGGNMLLRRDLFRTLAGFREDLGKGQSGYAEDTEFMQRLGKSGETIVYAPTARIYHVIDFDRATASYLRDNAFDKGRSYALSMPRETRFLRFTAARLADIAAFYATCLRWQFAGDPNRAVTAAVNAAYERGRLAAHLKRKS